MKNPKWLAVIIVLIDVLVFLAISIKLIPDLGIDPDASVALIVSFVLFVFVLGIPFVLLGPLARWQTLQEKGETTQARLLEYADTGSSINGHPLINMVLEICPSGGAPYQTTMQSPIPRFSVDRLQYGANLVVKVDPDHPQIASFVSFDRRNEQRLTIGKEMELVIQQARLAELDELRKRSIISEMDYQNRIREISGLN